MRTSNIKPANIKYILLISALILFHFLSNYIWCSNDWLTTEDDMSDHLVSHLMLYTDIKELLPLPLNIISKICGMIKLIKHYSVFNYPPLVYFVSSVIGIIFNSSHMLTVRMSNMLYFSILIISIFLIGRVCFSRPFGLIAAGLVSFYPAVAGASRLYSLDFPLTSLTTFSIYCLIRTGYFTKFKESVFFGLALGLGILVKGQILFFVIGPFLYAAIKGLIKRRHTSSILKNIIISLAIAGFISSIWWLPHFRFIVQKFSEQVFISYTGLECPEWIGGLMELKLFSPDWIFAYAYFLLNNITPGLFILFLLGLACFFRIKMKHKGVVFTWLFVSYILLTIFSVKKDRFFLPALPAIALISGSFFYSIRNRKIQKTILLIVIMFAFIQFMFLSYSEESSKAYWYAKKNSIFHISTPMNNVKVYGSPGPKGDFYENICIQPHRSNIESVALNLLKKIDGGLLKKDVRIGMLGYNLPWNLDFSIRYLWKSQNANIKFYKIGQDNHFPLGENKKKAADDNIYDYIIALRDRNSSESFSDTAINDDLVKDFLKAGLEDPDRYILIETKMVLPDNYAVFLFKRE